MVTNEQARIASIVFGRMRAAMPQEPIVVRSWQDEEGFQEIDARSMNMMDMPTGAGSGTVEQMGPHWVAGAVIHNIWRENNWTWQQWEDYRMGRSHLPITLAFCGVDFDEAHRIIESALIDLEQSAARMVTHSHTYSTAIMTIQLAQRYVDVLVALEGN